MFLVGDETAGIVAIQVALLGDGVVVIVEEGRLLASRLPRHLVIEDVDPGGLVGWRTELNVGMAGFHDHEGGDDHDWANEK